MLRLASLLPVSLALLAGACALDTDGPETSPGELTRVRDQAFLCDDTPDDPSWACTIELTLAGTQLTSIGIHNDGSATGPRATGVLSETARADLDALIATVPTSIDDSDETIGCGLGPISSRTYTIDFETKGLTDLVYHSAEVGPLHELKNRVTALITAIDTCAGSSDLTLSSCTPRLQPNQ